MSRIHEALKKAAQERSEQLSGRSAQELLEIVGEAPLASLEPTAVQRETLNPSVSRGRAGEAREGLGSTDW